jgi:ribosomal protein L31
MSKGMSMPQKYGAASSYGKKYALGNLLLIDDTADADASNDHSGKTDKEEITSKKSPLYTKALKFVEGGGDLAAISKKYKMTAIVKKGLEDVITKALTL